MTGFLEMLADEVRTLFVGDPEEAEVDIAPLVSDLAVARIKAVLEEAVGRGAEVLAGGHV
jgi:acyl-CoA reductase-like NAD-dependent aldehyde dehydrogenase